MRFIHIHKLNDFTKSLLETTLFSPSCITISIFKFGQAELLPKDQLIMTVSSAKKGFHSIVLLQENVETVELIHECGPQRLRMGTAKKNRP